MLLLLLFCGKINFRSFLVRLACNACELQNIFQWPISLLLADLGAFRLKQSQFHFSMYLN